MMRQPSSTGTQKIRKKLEEQVFFLLGNGSNRKMDLTIKLKDLRMNNL